MPNSLKIGPGTGIVECVFLLPSEKIRDLYIRSFQDEKISKKAYEEFEDRDVAKTTAA